MAHVLDPDGTTRPWMPANGRTFTLHELQTAVGGYIEAIRLPDDPLGRVAYLVVNEDGKREQLPPNALATHVLHMAGGAAIDYVVGVAIVASVEELNGIEDEQEEP
jgi:hypothetical protein